jgi:predicted RNase H-like HicB family nuclease
LTDANRYPANVFWSEEDEGFIAVASDLPGCSAFGETQHEALTELQSAIGAWIEAARAAGNPIPDPSQPAAENIYSGKILVRMPKSLHAQLARAAKTEAVSLNQHIVFLLTWAATHRTLTTDWVIAGTARSPSQSSFQVGVWSIFNFGKVETPSIMSMPNLPIETLYFTTTSIPKKVHALGSRTT